MPITNSSGTGKVCILFAGRLIQKKGLAVLIDALPFINTDLEWELLIYGKGNEESHLREKVKNLNIASNIRFMGNVPYAEMQQVYNQADIFVLPSLRESGGSVLIEAMSHGLPVVALDMSLSRYLSRKKCGCFVNPEQSKEDILKGFAKCLSELISDEELRKSCGRNGYDFVNQEFTWDNMIKTVYQL